jgi:glycosyltransferase involved in cell wall biosynthesis
MSDDTGEIFSRLTIIAAVPPPAISIIVRTMGGVRLSEALQSLAEQTRIDFEVVVVDMSGGASAEVLTNARLPRLQVLEREPMSRPVALNVGIAAANAAVVGILDDDNLYDAQQIDLLLGGLDASNADYVYCGVRHVTYAIEDHHLISTRDVSRPFEFETLIFGNFIYATGSAFRKSLWDRAGRYDERFEVFEDWEFLIRAAQIGTVAHLDIVCGESRKFTGDALRSSFEREIAAVRRCQAGLYWKHRRLYLRNPRRRAMLETFAAHCEQRSPARRGILAVRVCGWRLELFADLAAWFLHALRWRWKRASGDDDGAVHARAEARA